MENCRDKRMTEKSGERERSAKCESANCVKCWRKNFDLSSLLSGKRQRERSPDYRLSEYQL